MSIRHSTDTVFLFNAQPSTVKVIPAQPNHQASKILLTLQDKRSFGCDDDSVIFGCDDDSVI